MENNKFKVFVSSRICVEHGYEVNGMQIIVLIT